MFVSVTPPITWPLAFSADFASEIDIMTFNTARQERAKSSVEGI